MKRAFIIVDIQPTFCEGGSLPVNGGNAVAQRIANYIAMHRGDYDFVVTTQDWHIDPGAHFSDTPDFVDTWPVHALAGSDEAELHPALDGLNPEIRVKKGHYKAAYSGFEGITEDERPLADVLHEYGVTDVDVVGLAESHCVSSTALDAVEAGFNTRVILNLTEPVTQELGEKARCAMRDAGIILV